MRYLISLLISTCLSFAYAEDAPVTSSHITIAEADQAAFIRKLEARTEERHEREERQKAAALAWSKKQEEIKIQIAKNQELIDKGLLTPYYNDRAVMWYYRTNLDQSQKPPMGKERLSDEKLFEIRTRYKEWWDSQNQ